MRGIEIDPVNRTARVEAGVVWAEVAEAAGQYGLAALAGSSPDVGVVGYTLGGGLSWLGRRYGLAASNVVSVEIVTADGAIRRIDAETDPDLFWAVRGGGGSFGAVTAIEFALFPVAEVYAGVMLWPIERASEILHAWREWTAEMPDDMTTVGRLLQLPPIPDIPEPLRGRSFVAVQAFYLGIRGRGRRARRRRSGRSGPRSTRSRPSRRRRSSTSTWIPSTPFPAWATGCSSTTSPPQASTPSSRPRGRARARRSLSVEVRQLGGALATPAAGGGAVSHLDADFACSASGSRCRPSRVPP